MAAQSLATASMMAINVVPVREEAVHGSLQDLSIQIKYKCYLFMSEPIL
jgi:hypothetical protein